MKTISVAIGEARSDLCKLVNKVKSGGVRVLLTSHGEPKAVLERYREQSAPWRVAVPDNPKRYGDLQSPVLEDWK